MPTLNAYSQEQYRGSITNKVRVQEAIRARYGETEASNYDPKLNCFTEKVWKTKGFKVSAKEEPIATISTLKTFFVRDDVTGQYRPSGRRPAIARLYYVLQVEPA